MKFVFYAVTAILLENNKIIKMLRLGSILRRWCNFSGKNYNHNNRRNYNHNNRRNYNHNVGNNYNHNAGNNFNHNTGNNFNHNAGNNYNHNAGNNFNHNMDYWHDVEIRTIRNTDSLSKYENINNNAYKDKHEALRLLTPSRNPYVVDKHLEDQINDILFMANPKIKKVIKYYEEKVCLYDINKRNYILLHGPPGCGKTHLASHISLKTNKKLVALNLSQIKSQWVGEEPKSINKCLMDIDKYFNNEIIIIDEIDTIMCKRKYDSVSARDSSASVNILLSWMDGVNTSSDSRILLFTTNKKNELDDAFLDRLTYNVEIKNISKEQMYEYWKQHLNYLNESELLRLSNLNFSSFRIANNVLKNVVINKIKEKKYDGEICVEDIVKEYKKVNNNDKIAKKILESVI